MTFIHLLRLRYDLDNMKKKEKEIEPCFESKENSTGTTAD